MGAAVAAIIYRKEHDIIDQFRAAGALSPERARTADQVHVDETWIFKRMRDRDVIRATTDGRLYLDEGTWQRVHGRRRRLALFVSVAAIVLMIASLWYVSVLARGRQ